jgi:COP9 signalosome complex subunit 1
MEAMDIGGPDAAAAVEVTQFDVESYISRYSDHTRQKRLRFIAKKAEELKHERTKLEAYKLLLDTLKQGHNTAAYKEACAKVGDKLGPQYAIDMAWITRIDKAAKAQLDRMEQDLQVSKNNSMKDGIRMGYNDIGEFQYDRGELQASLKSFLRNRDYSHQSKYELEFVLNLLRVKINIPHFVQMDTYISKGEKNSLVELKASDSPEVTSTKLALQARLTVSSGLAHLAARKYGAAAHKFCETPPELQYNAHPFSNWTKQVIAPKDVAAYGGLCALAEFDRKQIQLLVIDEGCSFKKFLELYPEVRELVNDFHNSRYTSCLRTLDALKAELCYDVHLHDHLDPLCDKIRSRALVQYFSPYMKLDLQKMAEAFNTDTATIEDEVATLIMSGEISARIDSDKKHLIACQTNQRQATFVDALKTGANYISQSKEVLLRTNLSRHDFLSRPQTRAAGGSGNGKGGGRSAVSTPAGGGDLRFAGDLGEDPGIALVLARLECSVA